MKLKDDFVTYDLNGETVIVCASGEFAGIAKGNETAAFILECLKEQTTVEGIAEKLLERYPDAPKDIVKPDVERTIAKLREMGAIED